MLVHVLTLVALALGIAAVVAAGVALLVAERRLRRWSLIAFVLAAADAGVHHLARNLGPPTWVSRLALLAAMLACAAPAARWVFTALVDASAD